MKTISQKKAIGFLLKAGVRGFNMWESSTGGYHWSSIAGWGVVNHSGVARFNEKTKSLNWIMRARS